MERHKIPTAKYRNFASYDEATKYIDSISHDVVIKASGLAAGKGVIIPTTKEEAHNALKDIMANRVFGEAGRGSILYFRFMEIGAYWVEQVMRLWLRNTWREMS